MAKKLWNFPSRNCFYQDREEDKKVEQEAKARKKIARNNEVLGMLKAGISAIQIATTLPNLFGGMIARKIPVIQCKEK